MWQISLFPSVQVKSIRCTRRLIFYKSQTDHTPTSPGPIHPPGKCQVPGRARPSLTMQEPPPSRLSPRADACPRCQHARGQFPLQVQLPQAPAALVSRDEPFPPAQAYSAFSCSKYCTLNTAHPPAAADLDISSPQQGTITQYSEPHRAVRSSRPGRQAESPSGVVPGPGPCSSPSGN